MNLSEVKSVGGKAVSSRSEVEARFDKCIADFDNKRRTKEKQFEIEIVPPTSNFD